MGKVKTTAAGAHASPLFHWEGIEQAASLLRAIDHPVSQKLLQAIYRHGQVSLVTLCKELGPRDEALAPLLADLYRAGYLDIHRKGRTRLYSVNEPRLQLVLDLLDDFV